MTAQPTASTVNRVRRWRYHSAVNAARMLNALADPGGREHGPALTDQFASRAPSSGPGRTSSATRGLVTSR